MAQVELPQIQATSDPGAARAAESDNPAQRAFVQAFLAGLEALEQIEYGELEPIGVGAPVPR